MTTCPACKGTGFVIGGAPAAPQWVPCGTCLGSGRCRRRPEEPKPNGKHKPRKRRKP